MEIIKTNKFTIINPINTLNNTSSSSSSSSSSSLNHLEINNLICQLYSNNSYNLACNLSTNERKLSSSSSSSNNNNNNNNNNENNNESKNRDFKLTYGEIDNQSFIEIIQFIKNIKKNQFIETFIDLGSGSGKSSFIASLVYNFKNCIGIEILSSLYNLSMTYLESWKTIYPQSSTNFEFYEGSFLDLNLYNWTNGDVVFANSTCYGLELIHQISIIAGDMKLGSYFISFTHPLHEIAGFEVIEEVRKEMSWGMADVFIQQKIR